MLLQRIADSGVRDSLSDMHHLQQQVNRLLSLGTGAPDSNEFPAINVWTSEDGAVVRTEIPGVESENVDISLVNDTLTIRGERRPETKKEHEICHRHERGYGQFARSVKLPFAVEPDAVKAEFKDGILQIELPRAAAEKPRKINVRCE